MQLCVAIPGSLVSDIPHLREKTDRIGMIARALAIFRVNEVIIFPDRLNENQKHEMETISTILSYMETPQYLRKHLFPISPSLEFAGILPPLRTPHHPLNRRIKNLREGEYRDGVVVKSGKEVLVDIGVERPIHLNERAASLGQRVTVRIYKYNDKIIIKKVVKANIRDLYLGYRVSVSDLSLGRILGRGMYDLIVLTSRYGKPLIDTLENLKKRLKEAENVLIVFGSPRKGLSEILEQEKIKMNVTDVIVVNTIPNQGTETIRTEEALYATLAVLNVLSQEINKDGS